MQKKIGFILGPLTFIILMLIGRFEGLSQPAHSILSSTLYFKTNQMKYYQEFQLSGREGLYRFIYKPKAFPASRIQYYFTIMTPMGIFGAPINDQGNLTPIDKLLVNPVEYFKQQSRLNR